MRRSLSLAVLVLLPACSHGGGAPGAGIAPRLPLGAAPVAASSAAPSITGAARPPVVQGVARPLGDPPSPVSEPANVDRSSPKALLDTLAAAIKANDPATIARLRASTAGKPALDEHDTDRARLDFLSHGLESHWTRVLQAVDPASLAAAPGQPQDHVLARADVGGALGVVTLRLDRTASGWVLR